MLPLCVCSFFPWQFFLSDKQVISNLQRRWSKQKIMVRSKPVSTKGGDRATRAHYRDKLKDWEENQTLLSSPAALTTPQPKDSNLPRKVDGRSGNGGQRERRDYSQMEGTLRQAMIDCLVGGESQGSVAIKYGIPKEKVKSLLKKLNEKTPTEGKSDEEKEDAINSFELPTSGSPKLQEKKYLSAAEEAYVAKVHSTTATLGWGGDKKDLIDLLERHITLSTGIKPVLSDKYVKKFINR